MNTVTKFSHRIFSEYRWLLLCVTAGILYSLYVHLKVSWSPLQTDPQAWIKFLEFHQQVYPFTRRLFQSNLTILVHNIFGFSLKLSFYLIQYLVSAFLAFFFYSYLKKLGFNRCWSNIGTAMLILSLPVAAAFIEPVHSWDDFWMYLFSVLFLKALIDKKWLLSSLYMTLGCFAREQMLLFFPFFLFEIWRHRRQIGWPTAGAAILLPLLVYGTFYIGTFEPGEHKRWKLITYNFEHSARTADSTISIWNAFGFLWITSVLGVFKAPKMEDEQSWRFCLTGALWLVPVTLILGVFFTLVRETRILFPPFVFVIPLSLWALKYSWSNFTKTNSIWFWTVVVIAAAILIPAGLELSRLIWPQFEFVSSTITRRNFAGVNIGLVLFYLVFFYVSRLKAN